MELGPKNLEGEGVGSTEEGGDSFSRVEIGQVNSEERAHRQKK